MGTISVQARRCNSNAKLITDVFLSGEDMPFAGVLPAETIRTIFQKHDSWFGDTYNAIYNTAIVLWAFLSQTLSDGKSRSCSAAVARIIAFLMSVGKEPPSTDKPENQAAFPQSRSQKPGDIAVFDRDYSSYMMLALLMACGADICTRIHHPQKHPIRPKRSPSCTAVAGTASSTSATSSGL